jgi:hypothetical protein
MTDPRLEEGAAMKPGQPRDAKDRFAKRPVQPVFVWTWDALKRLDIVLVDAGPRPVIERPKPPLRYEGVE